MKTVLKNVFFFKCNHHSRYINQNFLEIFSILCCNSFNYEYISHLFIGSIYHSLISLDILMCNHSKFLRLSWWVNPFKRKYDSTFQVKLWRFIRIWKFYQALYTLWLSSKDIYWTEHGIVPASPHAVWGPWEGPGRARLSLWSQSSALGSYF